MDIDLLGLTFERRVTIMPSKIDAFTDVFINDKQKQWDAFVKRLSIQNAPASYKEVVTSVSDFLLPIVMVGSSHKPEPETWVAPGPWK